MKETIESIMSLGDDDYYALGEEEKIVYNAQSILNAVNGSGLLEYYKGVCGGYACDAIEQLYSIGMDEIAAVMESANAIFPESYPPEDITERLDVISDFEDEFASLFDEWTDEILEFSQALEDEIKNIEKELEEAE